MDNARIFMSLRPDATFTDNHVNFFSLATITKTYIGGDMPTQAEMDAEAVVLQAQDDDVDYQNTLTANELADPKKAFAALMELLWDNSAELQAAFPNPNGQSKFKQAAVAGYKAKL